MTPFWIELAETDPLKAFSALHSQPYALLLDSADQNHSSARYSYILYNPATIIEAKGHDVIIRSAASEDTLRGADPFTILEEQLKAFGDSETIPDLPPFQGGAAGLFGYDLGRTLETLPATAKAPSDVPDMAVGIYDHLIAFDHAQNKAWIITHAADEAEARIKQKDTLRLLERNHLEQSRNAAAPYLPVALNWESNMDTDIYEQAIIKTLDYIYAGEIYQANIAQRFEADLPGDFNTYAHYLRLRDVNPAPFASYFNLGDAVISSASPERFLTVDGHKVETRPIKGTRPRAGDDALDEHYTRELLNSEKDRAENIMIVDLMRNDLSKVCRARSVEVSQLCGLESFASVHHLVSIVKGELKEDKSALDLLRACFPGGSITGAPKIRAQQVIEEIEDVRRGPYCGSIGYIGFNGIMDSSILIRTLVYEDRKVSLSVGSGIVADSDIDAEYQETFDKADAIFQSFDGLAYEIEEEYLAAMVGIDPNVIAAE